MNDKDLIALMVEETIQMAQDSSYPFLRDDKRGCFVLKLSQVLEIPYGFGPFISKNKSHISIGPEDTYLYPTLEALLGVSNATYEFSFEDEVVYVHKASSEMLEYLQAA